MNFGLWLKDERLKQQLSGRDLSSRVGKSSSYISQIESGKSIQLPSKDSAMKVIQALGYTDEEEVKNLLIQFGIIKNQESLQDSFEEDVEEKKEKYIQEIYRDLTGSSVDTVQGVYHMLHQYRDILVKIKHIHEATHHLNSKYPMIALREYVEFLATKYQK